MLEKTVVVGPFQCNCRILACPETGETLVIDPGDEPEVIVQAIQTLQQEARVPLRVTRLLHTHGHLDHINATTPLRRKFPESRVQAHEGDAELFRNLALQGQMFGLPVTEAPIIDHYLEDEEVVASGGLRLHCLHTPGHSPGGLCFLVNGQLYSGDTLFAGNVGRTDLWGGDEDLLLRSIRRRLLTLEDDVRVHPGHGPSSTIGIEKRTNPFL